MDAGGTMNATQDIEEALAASDLFAGAPEEAIATLAAQGRRRKLKKGETLKCVVLEVDQEKQRIALGLKQMTEDPWVEAIPTHYQPGMIVQGKVTKITNFGVFVELEDDLEGLLHISELADHKVENPQEVVEPGQDLEVKILRVDMDERKIGLSLKRAQWTSDQDAAATRAEAKRSPAAGGGGLGGLGDTGALGTDKITFGPGGAKSE